MRMIKNETFTMEPYAARKARKALVPEQKMPDAEVYSAADLIAQIVDARVVQTPQGQYVPQGMGVKEITQCARIQEACEAAKDTIFIEEADWLYIRERLETHKWLYVHPAIPKLEDAIMSAPKQTEPAAASDEAKG